MSRQPAVRVLFVVAPAEFYPGTIVRVREFFGRLRAMGIQPTELRYISGLRDQWHGRFVAGPRKIRFRPAREVVRGALNVFGRLYIGLRQLQILVLAERVDAVYVQWVLAPVWLIRWLAWRGVRIVYDFDDAVFLKAPERAQAVISLAWRVVAGSHFNLEYARARNPASALVPSSVPIERFRRHAMEERPDGPIRIGWVGSPSTLSYLEQLAEPLRRLAERGLPAALLIAGSRDRPDLIPDVGAMPVDLVSNYSGGDLPELVTRIDIGVMPLGDTPWERGKCAMKALVYMAGGAPVVCSPVGEARYVVEDGVSGFFADSAEEWESVLAALVEDAALRNRVGLAGRAVVKGRYSSDVCFGLLRDHVFAPLLEQVGRRGHG
jgi:glycosyltransferase involved in cell wall biosynthesis